MSDVNDSEVLAKLFVNIVRANSRDAVEGEIELEREEIERKNDFVEDPQELADVIESDVDEDEILAELNDALANNDDQEERPKPEQPGGTV